MVELSIHKDPILFFRSLKIMKRHFEYRNDIMKLFLSLSVYDNDNGVELAQEINEKRKILVSWKKKTCSTVVRRASTMISWPFWSGSVSLSSRVLIYP